MRYNVKKSANSLIIKYQHNHSNVELCDLTPIIHRLVENLYSLLKMYEGPEYWTKLLDHTISNKLKSSDFSKVLSSMIDITQKTENHNANKKFITSLLEIRQIFAKDKDFFIKNFGKNIPQRNREEFLTRYTQVSHEIVKEHIAEVIQIMRKEIEEKKKKDVCVFKS